jgi:fructuronate reductase
VLKITPGTTTGQVDALLGIEEVFAPELAADAAVRELVIDWVDALTRHGVAATVSGL